MTDDVIAALAFVVLVGVVPAVVVARSVAFAVPLSAAVLMVTSSLGATIGVVMGVSVVGSVALLLVIANGVALTIGVRRLRDPVRARSGARARFGGMGAVAWFVVVAVGSLGAAAPEPLGWDPRSIWWFHASWLAEGGAAARRAIANPVFAFSHPDYPVGVPASVATFWRAAGSGRDLVLAQALTVALTGLAVAGVAVVLTHRRRGVATLAAATVFVFAAVLLGDGQAAYGYVDVLGAAFLVAALAAFVGIGSRPLALAVGGLSLAGAGVTKNEGLVFGLVVLAVAAGFAPSRRRWVAVCGGAALVPAVLWQLAVRSTGVAIDGDVGAGSLLHVLSARSQSRFSRTFDAVLDENAWIVGLAVLALVGAWIMVAGVGARRGSRGWLGLATALVVAAVLLVGVMTVVYAVGNRNLSWWLATSLDRVSSTPQMFAIAALVPLTGGIVELLTSPAVAPRSNVVGGSRALSG